MNAGQYEGLMRLLTEVRDRMPERSRDTRTWSQVGGDFVHNSEASQVLLTTHHLDGSKTVATKGDNLVHGTDWQVGAIKALQTVREVLDDWIRGAKENHQAMGHRHESRGDECWRSFTPSDFRNMINDAARELDLSEFPAAAFSSEEDKPL